MLKITTLLGIGITTSDRGAILETVTTYLKRKDRSLPLIIFTPNPEQIVLAQKDKEFRSILNSADIALPDGVGVVWAMKIVGSRQWAVGRIKEKAKEKFLLRTVNPSTPLRAGYKLPTLTRIPGIEFMEELVKSAAENGYPVAFIGSRRGRSLTSLKVLKEKYPGLNGWAQDGPELEVSSSQLAVRSSKLEDRSKEKTTTNPSTPLRAGYELRTLRLRSGQATNFKVETEEYFKQLVERIIKSRTRLVFVGLGAPKQEYFIKELSTQFAVSSLQKKTTAHYSLPTANSLVLMSVGGAFDILSGRIPRAPQFIRVLSLEWLWRLFHEPWRLRRQLQLLKFFLLTLKHQFVIQ